MQVSTHVQQISDMPVFSLVVESGLAAGRPYGRGMSHVFHPWGWIHAPPEVDVPLSARRTYSLTGVGNDGGEGGNSGQGEDELFSWGVVGLLGGSAMEDTYWIRLPIFR